MYIFFTIWFNSIENCGEKSSIKKANIEEWDES